MDKRIAEWLASGDTGTSSKAIMLWLSAGVTDKTWGASTPSDTGDLARCLRLLDRVPEWKSRIPDMAGAGGEWPTMVRYWGQIVALFLSEVGGSTPAKNAGWSAPKTYKLMKRVQEEARQEAGTAGQYVQVGDRMEIRFPFT